MYLIVFLRSYYIAVCVSLTCAANIFHSFVYSLYLQLTCAPHVAHTPGDFRLGYVDNAVNATLWRSDLRISIRRTVGVYC